MPFSPLSGKAGLTSVTVSGGRSVLIDNQIGLTPADALIDSVAAGGAEEGYTVISDSMTDERARKGVYHFCTLLKPGNRKARITMVQMLSALSICRALEQNASVQPQIKWLSDVTDNRKLLCRTEIRSILLPTGFIDYLILHLTVALPPSLFPQRLSDVVGEVFTGQSRSPAHHVAESFVSSFFDMYDRSEASWQLYFDEYCRRSSIIGKRVWFRTKKGKRLGKVLRIDPEGHLVLQVGLFSTETLESPRELLS